MNRSLRSGDTPRTDVISPDTAEDGKGLYFGDSLGLKQGHDLCRQAGGIFKMIDARMLGCRHNAGDHLLEAYGDEEVNSGNTITIRISRKRVVNKIALFQLINKNPTLSEKMFQTHLRNEIKPRRDRKDPAGA